MDASAGDLHLSPSDDCARSASVDVSDITVTDIDGDPHPLGSWDVGADETQ